MIGQDQMVSAVPLIDTFSRQNQFPVTILSFLFASLMI